MTRPQDCKIGRKLTWMPLKSKHPENIYRFTEDNRPDLPGIKSPRLLNHYVCWDFFHRCKVICDLLRLTG